MKEPWEDEVRLKVSIFGPERKGGENPKRGGLRKGAAEKQRNDQNKILIFGNEEHT